MRWSGIFRLACALLVAGLVATACDAGGGPEQLPPLAATPTHHPEPTGLSKVNTVAFIASDEGLLGPSGLPPGWTQFALQNTGKQPHQLQLVLLGDKTKDDLLLALRGDAQHLPDWARPMGGPNTAAAGESSRVAIDLQAGHYVALSLLPAPDGLPEALHGLLAEFSVDASPISKPKVPQADAEIAVSDTDIQLPVALAAGEHTLSVKNNGQQTHEVAVVLLTGSATAQDYLKALASGPANTSGKPYGGIGALAPGGQGYIILQLNAGRYALLSALHGADGKPDYTRGLVLEFSVK